MNIAFIACEYNPFHNGHLHHIEETKKQGADAVVCIMSGNFVQRGSIAVAEKHLRAKSALISGADLVIELPMKYAISTASIFAEGFIKTAKATGLQGFISFGCKNSLNDLLKVKDIIFSDAAEEFALNSISQGINYPKAKAQFLINNTEERLHSIADDANNILALEYLNARDRFFPGLGILAIKRKGTMHDSDDISENITSAGNIRRRIYNEISDEDAINNIFSIKDFLPEKVFSLYLEAFTSGLFPADTEKFDTACYSRLISADKNLFAQINNVTGGLENRISDSIARNSTIEEVCDNVKTKAFTHSRIRQILLSSALGVTKDDINNDISYLRILGFNERGRAILSSMRKTALCPVITNLSQANAIGDNVQRDITNDYTAGKLFNLCLPCPVKGNPEYDIPPVYIKSEDC